MINKVLMISLMFLLVLGLTGLMAEGQGEGEAGSKKLTIYASIDEEACNASIAAFEKETGINVEFVRLSSGEAEARIDAEKENPQASIWFGGVGLNHISAKNKGLTEPYDSQAKAKIPDNFKDKEGYWTGIYANPLCFVSNTKVLENYSITAPESWEELADPKYKGHIQVANPGSSGTSYNVVATLVQQFGEDKAFEMLMAIDKNIDMYTRSGSAPARKTAIGEVTVAIGYAGIGVRLLSEGYPVKITFPKEGTGFEIASISMIKNGPKSEKENAKLFYDWAIGEEAAKIYAAGRVVPLIEVPLPEGNISITDVNTIDQDDEWAAANKERLIEKWNQIVGGEAKTEPPKE